MYIIYYTNKKDDSLSKTYTYNNLTTKIIDTLKTKDNYLIFLCYKPIMQTFTYIRFECKLCWS